MSCNTRYLRNLRIALSDFIDTKDTGEIVELALEQLGIRNYTEDRIRFLCAKFRYVSPVIIDFIFV
jgi:hypothetical protein